ncbi:hypothetical protein L198_02793 [Cryptococcus wingfieldii CBS 7118]|uniref:GATA-type domain-containing protein n=1 Tax=Cryptococcus wingfieldii CBS 7118 TaxID=1295528 RepID=A0A1E3JQ67_9TREE|nr:hypothetical protein L198_02793 [Cryptococcus wingfieldii CBS 7118]ODO02062.1 hypothetical protein L198_02793 [Cryptococcus wingfieldii CBS 7118]
MKYQNQETQVPIRPILNDTTEGLKRPLAAKDSPRAPTSGKPKKRRILRPGRCANCGCNEEETSLWRTNVDAGKDESEKIVCNACGLWRSEHGFPRPKRMSNMSPRLTNTKFERDEAGLKNHQRSASKASSDDSSSDETEVDDVIDAANILMDLATKWRVGRSHA